MRLFEGNSINALIYWIINVIKSKIGYVHNNFTLFRIQYYLITHAHSLIYDTKKYRPRNKRVYNIMESYILCTWLMKWITKLLADINICSRPYIILYVYKYSSIPHITFLLSFVHLQSLSCAIVSHGQYIYT